MDSKKYKTTILHDQNIILINMVELHHNRNLSLIMLGLINLQRNYSSISESEFILKHESHEFFA